MKPDKFYSLITIGIISVLLVSCASEVETVEPATRKNEVLIAETVAQADNLCRRHEDLSELRECVNLLAHVRNPETRNYEVEWKFAKYNYFLGKQTENDGESQKFLEAGEEAGKIASKVAPVRLHLGQAYLAVNRKEDAKKQLEYVLNMKPNPDFLPEYNESVEEAKKLLKTRF